MKVKCKAILSIVTFYENGEREKEKKERERERDFNFLFQRFQYQLKHSSMCTQCDYHQLSVVRTTFLQQAQLEVREVRIKWGEV
jgi:hypothetical protein